MKLYIVSDLHLEFGQFQPPESADAADVIVLAGDIWKKDHGIHWARATWPDHPIVYLAGNHEFYGSQRLELLTRLRTAAEETGIHFLENDEVVLNGVRILGGTLWTNFELFGPEQRSNAMIDSEQALRDFRVIENGEWNFTAQDSINLHRKTVEFLEERLARPFDGPTVVVTHHAPSWESVVPRYRSTLVSAAFASRLDHLLGKSELWIHGHMHSSLDYLVNGTRIICNPRGYSRYVGSQENDSFNPMLVVEVTKGSVVDVPTMPDPGDAK